MSYKEQTTNGKTEYGKGKEIEKLFIRTGPSSKELKPSKVDSHFTCCDERCDSTLIDSQ